MMGPSGPRTPVSCRTNSAQPAQDSRTVQSLAVKHTLGYVVSFKEKFSRGVRGLASPCNGYMGMLSSTSLSVWVPHLTDILIKPRTQTGEKKEKKKTFKAKLSKSASLGFVSYLAKYYFFLRLIKILLIFPQVFYCPRLSFCLVIVRNICNQ